MNKLKYLQIIVIAVISASCATIFSSPISQNPSQIVGEYTVAQISDIAPVNDIHISKLCPTGPPILLDGQGQPIDDGFDIWANSIPAGSLIHGLFDDDIEQATPIGQQTYHVPANIPLRIYIQAMFTEGGYLNGPLTVHSMVILDEQQLEGGFEGIDGGHLETTLEPGVRQEITVTLPPLVPGGHDLLTLGFYNFLNEVGDKIKLLSASRVSLIAGEEALIQPRTFRIFNGEGNRDNTTHYFLQELSPKVGEIGQSFELLLSTNYTDVHYGGYEDLPSPELQNMAILLFDNYEQVNFSTESEILYAAIDTRYQTTNIPITYTPQTSGEHELIVFAIVNPGIPGCLLTEPELGVMLLDRTDYAYTQFTITE